MAFMEHNNDSVALQRVSLKNLVPNMSRIMIVGIIIGKQRPKIFETQSEQEKRMRAVWNFTLRDSIQHYINVTYWGSTEKIYDVYDKFKTGDTVEILDPDVLMRKTDDRFELFHPMVTSPYKLTLNDKSDMIAHPDGEILKSLLKYPTKPTLMYVPLQDIHNNGSAIKYADVLGAIRGLGQMRTVRLKTKETVHVREIEVFDHTCPSMKVTLWDSDFVSRSMNWKPRKTILFMTDLKIDWSFYSHNYIGVVTGRTIITENPVSKEAQALYNYAQDAPIQTFDIVEQLLTCLPSANAHEDVISVKQLQDRINIILEGHQGTSKSFTAVVYAFVGQFDLDGLLPNVIVKCTRCQMIIKDDKCENPECAMILDSQPVETEISFSIRVMLSDHTGTITNCRLTGKAAEQALNCSAQTFSTMTDDEKSTLKWKYLLERCKTRIAVIFMISQRPIISILQIEIANGEEIAKLLPVY